MKKACNTKKYAVGGLPKAPKSPQRSLSDDLIPRSMLPDRPGIPAGKEFGAGIPRKRPAAPKKMASGGSVGSASKRADGCAVKGKTRGTMIKMAMGGKC